MPASVRHELAVLADIAVSGSFRSASRRIAGTPTEPDLVLSFFAHGLEEIENDWNGLLRPFSLSVTASGIFVHQTPKVEPSHNTRSQGRADRRFPKIKTASCELGDLLVILTHDDGRRAGSGNAVMLQAKCGFPSKADPLQRVLYEECEAFTYTRSGPVLNGQRRELKPKTDLALAYWDLHSDFAVSVRPYSMFLPTFSIWAADARRDRIVRGGFGGMLVDLIFGIAGREFRCDDLVGTGWNRIVRDLIEVTAAKPLRKTPANLRGRLSSDLAAIQAAAHDPNGPLLVRNSLPEILLFLSKDFEKYAGAFRRSVSFDNPEFERYREKAEHVGGDGMPPLSTTLDMPEDPDGNGTNIVFIHCRTRAAR